ncbi:hypothetical protein AaE_000319 [Aphanomyces astaci]|uniref:Uncharacterized protein n=1 Tax=Aphanomyces astaci TaxID=112090 RepID=A0A6A5AZP3_APHAT|nr:hypothetical protein AaE_000319 [Aphanomyces astaci]
MAAVDDEAFFDHSQDHLYDSPNYVGSPMTAGYDSVVAAIEETSVNANDAIFMFVCHKLGGHPRAMVREYTLAKGLPTPKELEQQSGKRIAQPAPVVEDAPIVRDMLPQETKRPKKYYYSDFMGVRFCQI